MQIDRHKDAKNISNFIWDVFNKLGRIGDTHDDTLVISPNVKSAALCICEAADPTQELISPSLFPFEMLVLFHGATVPPNDAFPTRMGWTVKRSEIGDMNG